MPARQPRSGPLPVPCAAPDIGWRRRRLPEQQLAGKDARYFGSCGARPVVDFTDAGFPSTYMISLEELLSIHQSLIGHVRESQPEYILVEIADGIFQRETRMLLECAAFRAQVEHVFFAANDSLSASCGARCLKEYGLPLRAIGGTFTQSALAKREAEEAIGLPCLNLEEMLQGGILDALGLPRPASTPTPETPIVTTPVDAVNGNGHPAKAAGNGAPHMSEAVEEDIDVRSPAGTGRSLKIKSGHSAVFSYGPQVFDESNAVSLDRS